MKKKFNEFLKDIEEQKNEIRALFEQKKELYQAIAAFERDIRYDDILTSRVHC